MKKEYPITKSEFEVKYIKKYFSTNSLLVADDLTVIVRAHLLIEMLIEMLLRKKLVKNRILRNKDFTFDMKLSLVN